MTAISQKEKKNSMKATHSKQFIEKKKIKKSQKNIQNLKNIQKSTDLGSKELIKNTMFMNYFLKNQKQINQKII